MYLIRCSISSRISTPLDIYFRIGINNIVQLLCDTDVFLAPSLIFSSHYADFTGEEVKFQDGGSRGTLGA